MRVGVLFSGGKDSTLALMKAMETEEVVCLITVVSRNRESYMFHTPNIWLTKLQAEAIGLPLMRIETEGKQEEELEDLKKVMQEAHEKYQIEGVVTGAIESAYQSQRIQKICDDLRLCCVNPLWKRNQIELLEELVAKGFQVIISGVFAYPLDKSWLGKEIDKTLIEKLAQLQKQFGVSPSGEGGEIETTVLDAPFFRKKISILNSEIVEKGNSGVLIIKDVEMCEK
jgi:ABC transporter with metal-binding/Fe-S-binding domain ATP-binding protein